MLVPSMPSLALLPRELDFPTSGSLPDLTRQTAGLYHSELVHGWFGTS